MGWMRGVFFKENGQIYLNEALYKISPVLIPFLPILSHFFLFMALPVWVSSSWQVCSSD